MEIEIDARAVYAGIVTSSETLRPDDRARLFAILDHEPPEFAEAIHAYYRDADRADRTPRGILYFHIGLLCGAAAREADGGEA